MRQAARHAEPVLSLQGVAVYFTRRVGLFGRERFWALRDVSFDLYQGESLGIIGRNGAGKSTLLKLLAGIINPDKGQLERAPLRAELLSLQVGFSPHLTGRENAILSGMLMGQSRRSVEKCMDQIIGFAELDAFIDQPLGTYSSGMKARLGFAVAFQFDPDILLVDEVLGVGDVDFRAKSAEALQQKINSDRTVVLVSHSASTIRELCDRAVWIEQGITQMEGSTDAVLEMYESRARSLAQGGSVRKLTRFDVA